MTRTGRALVTLAVILALALVAGALTALFLYTHERVETTERTRPRGEAVTNPLFLLRQALRADGIDAHALASLDLDRFSSDPSATVLVHAPLGTLPRRTHDRLLEWVEQGGHLLLRTPGSRASDDVMPALLGELGLAAELAPAECAGLQVPGQERHVEFCNGRRFSLSDPTQARLAWPEEGPHVFVRLARGKGSVDVLSDFDFLGNRGMEDVPHQALARQLLAPNYGRGPIYLVYTGSATSRWQPLLERGWPVWLPLALLLLAWLWRRAQRFGPWLPSPVQERRSLLEHVRASGELLFRYGHPQELHAALRDAFLARLQRRDPATASLAGEDRIQAIAARVGLDPASVRTALIAPEPRDRQAFLARMRTLIQMRNRL
jgi:uncharacterized protein (TIGR03382 family)